MDILGISIDESSRGDIHSTVDRFFHGNRFRRIATVNPEFLVEAKRNLVFRETLRSADICIADGFGIVLVGFLRGKRINRYTGADLLEYLLVKANREGFGVFLAVREDGLSSFDEIKAALLKKYPKLNINGGDFDVQIRNNDKSGITKNVSIQSTISTILLCNFGAPAQEIFLESFRNSPGRICLAMGVGGAFDFLTGKRKRAPRWMRAVGLEWLWRLLREPHRAVRVWNATVVFSWKVLFEKKENPR